MLEVIQVRCTAVPMPDRRQIVLLRAKILNPLYILPSFDDTLTLTQNFLINFTFKISGLLIEICESNLRQNVQSVGLNHSFWFFFHSVWLLIKCMYKKYWQWILHIPYGFIDFTRSLLFFFSYLTVRFYWKREIIGTSTFISFIGSHKSYRSQNSQGSLTTYL